MSTGIAAPPSGMPAAWECGDCGWTMRQDQLPPGVRLHDVSSDHGETYCGRPPAW
ncbi:MAG: hypothetical protein V4510_06215 [bacterium]